MNKLQKISVAFRGIRPMMFDRYAGDNNTELQPAEKMYLDDNQHLMMPSVNLYSLLCAENTKSVCKQFFGRQWKTIALGISSFTSITPFDIPILDDVGNLIKFEGFNDRIFVHKAVARLARGIPNPKERPTLNLPWEIQFDIDYIENKYCTLENLRQALQMGGILGLGTFRPFFGRYELTKFDL